MEAYLWNYENTPIGFGYKQYTKNDNSFGGGDVTMNNGLIVTNNITANGNIVGDNNTNISQVNNITATSFTGIFQGALSGSAQIASNISGAFAVASASFASDINDLSNSSFFLTFVLHFSTRVTNIDSGSFSTRVTKNEGK